MPVKLTTLVEALGSAARRGSTGSIASDVDGVRRTIWVREGAVVFAESGDAAERFAAILAFRGILLERERMAIEAVAQPGLREDLAIASSGILGPVEVMEHARVVLEERLAGAFRVTGEVWTADPTPPPDDLPSVGLPIAGCLLAGIREMRPERLCQELPIGDGDVYAFRSAALAAMPSLSLTKEQARLTGALDGTRRWKDVVAASGVEPSAAHAALYALAVLGIAQYVPPGKEGTVPADVPVPATTASPIASPAAGKAAEMRDRAGRDIPKLLEIPPQAAPEVADDAFRALVARYDLGRAHFLGEADRDAALVLLDRAIDAHLVLTDAGSRARYLAAPEWDREVVAASLAARLAAEKEYVKGGVFLQAGSYLAAEAALLQGIQLRPRDARLHLRMGIAIYLRAKAKGDVRAPAGALRALQKAIALDPKCDEAFLYLGHIAMAAGDKYGAKTCYETALRLNPSSGEARRAIARAENA